MKVSKRSFRQKNPVRLIPHWRKGSYGGVCAPREGEGRSFTEWGILLEVLKWQACLELNRQRGTNVRFLPFTRHLAQLGINPAAAAISAISPALAQALLDGAYDPELDYRENRYFANSWQSSRARMYPLLTEQVVRCFNGSDFTGADLIAGAYPATVYLRIPERQLFIEHAGNIET